MDKSPDAFRTISEVAEWLDVPTHVLRFWESRFSQIKPVKRAGGRRYYRPSDMRVIGGVKTLLHDQGMTIRGVQKLFREQGLKHITSFSPPLFGEDGEDEFARETIEAAPAAARPATPAPAARSTRDAAPAPVLEAEDEGEAEAARPEAPVFSHRRAEPAARPAAESEVEPEIEEAEEVEEVVARVIPPTPDVPETDPEDDDPGHAAGAGPAVLLRLAGREALARHRDEIADAAGRLRALLDRVS